jgi:hypothetical protein
VDILLEDSGGNTAVYREIVVILPGLLTETAFEPEAADFLEPPPGPTDVTDVEFGTTLANDCDAFLQDLDDSVSPLALGVEIPAGTEMLYFTLAKNAEHSVVISGINEDLANTVEYAKGSYADDNLVVFSVDTSSVKGAEDNVEFTVTVTEKGKVGTLVTVTLALTPGLYIDIGTGGVENLVTVTDEDRGEGVIPAPKKDLQSCLTWLESNAKDNTSYVVLANQNSAMISFASKPDSVGVRITLQGINRERKIYAQSPPTAPFFTVDNGTTLALGSHITLGNLGGYQDMNKQVLIRTQNGGILEMLPGSKISRIQTTVLLINNDGGAFRMRGGVIEDNFFSRATSMVFSKGSFEMDDGAVIANNNLYIEVAVTPDILVGPKQTYSNPSVIYVTSGTFVMRGGEISNTNYRAVYINGGTFVMEGGVIKNNGKALAGVFEGQNIYQFGGGVYIKSGSFIMEGGEISDNGHSSVPGSGIYLETSGKDKLTLNGAVTIANNTLGFHRTNASIDYFPSLGSGFSSPSPIGVDLVCEGSAASNFASWWLGKQFLRAYSADPATIDGDLAAQFGPVKCYLHTPLVEDVSDAIRYTIADDGAIAVNNN